MSGPADDPGAWYRPATVHLVDYDARWPELYQLEAADVVAAIGADLVAIEHVGSTAVPGMSAKPIIDLLVAVESWDRFDPVTVAV